MSFLVRLPHLSTTQASMVRLEPPTPTSPTGLTEEMTILRRRPPPRPAPLLLLRQNLLAPRPDPAPPRLLRRRLGTIPPPHVGPNDADGRHDPGQEPSTHRNRTLSSGTRQLTAKLKQASSACLAAPCASCCTCSLVCCAASFAASSTPATWAAWSMVPSNCE
jgi:hypothetical protein